MTRPLGAFTVIALLGTAVAVSAAQAKPAAPVKAVPIAAKAAPAPKTTTLVANGKIAKFDAASNTLTVSTSQGDQQFMMAPTSTVTEDRKKVAASELGTMTDHEARIRYTESGGHKMVLSVQVMAVPRATQAKAIATKKAPKAKS
jgi:hypothetical protein